MQARRFLRMPEVVRLVGMCKGTIYLKMRKREFPMSIPVSPKVSVWDEMEILRWQNAQLKKREEKLALRDDA
jgi:prophage regulatory protein